MYACLKTLRMNVINCLQEMGNLGAKYRHRPTQQTQSLESLTRGNSTELKRKKRSQNGSSRKSASATVTREGSGSAKATSVRAQSVLGLTENGSSATTSSGGGGAKSGSSKKFEPKINNAQRDLIKECWETSKHGELGTRIYIRLFQKRLDIKKAYEAIEISKPGYTWKAESREFNKLLHDCITSLSSIENIEDMCHDWGGQFAALRPFGFKPQFWVPFSEIMTTECLYLDGGTHPVADMVDAWAALISVIFSSMRDGFYNELRLSRRQSRRRQSTYTAVSEYSNTQLYCSEPSADAVNYNPNPEVTDATANTVLQNKYYSNMIVDFQNVTTTPSDSIVG